MLVKLWIKRTIESRLELLVSQNKPKNVPAFLNLLPRILDHADSCRSLHDIWKLKAWDTSVWQCMAALGGIPGPLVVLP